MESQDSRKQAIQRELELVLASAAFSRNERQSRFLRFLVEKSQQGRSVELKESVIAVEVFGRQAGYDPKLDGIVRTEAVRLRSRLDKYYAAEGSHDPLVIELPKGGYRPVFREREAAATQAKSRPVWVPWIAGVLAVLAVAAVGATWWARANSSTVTVAVLPLENRSHDPASDYFADGLTDEVIRNLSMIERVTVPSRTSSFALKGKQLSAGEAGKQLGVEYLVEGSVLQAGQQLRVNVALIRVRDDFVLWSGRFDRELTDVFAIQDEISRGIVNGLRLKLDTGRRRYETNLEAYDLYLRGRQVMGSFPMRGQAIARRAVEYFDQALQKDPNYALALAGRADAFLAVDLNVIAPQAFEQAKAAAERATELDPMLSEAQSSLASVRARDYAWADAERGFRRAIDLNPNNTLAHLQLGMPVLIVQGRVDEGLAEVHRAVRLDPLSPYTNTEFGRALMWTGRYEEAIDQFHKAIALDPTRNRPYNLLGRALALQGKYTEAIGVLDENVRRGMSVDEQTGRVCVQMRLGRQVDALALLERGLSTRRSRHNAEVYGCLGDKPHTLEYLERALSEHEPGLAEILQAPELAWTRKDPDFTPLRKKLNLSQ